MLTFRVTHEYDAVYGWSYRCDEFRMSGAPDNSSNPSYADSRTAAESLAFFALDEIAKHRGIPVPRPDEVRFEHVLATAAGAGAPAAQSG
jgi:hypothetical protein